MRPLILLILLSFAGCTSYVNPSLDPSIDQGDQYTKDRDYCTKRSSKNTDSAPKNELRFLKTYEQQQKEYAAESRAFENCMSSKGWIKK